MQQLLYSDTPQGFRQYIDTLDTKSKYELAQLLMVQVQISETPEEKFHRHLNAWKNATQLQSNPYIYVQDPNFIAIAKMGEQAVPFILKEIEKSPSFLYHALDLICGEEPTKPQRQGSWNCFNIDESCKAWIKKLKE